jgi:hypothetical protein
VFVDERGALLFAGSHHHLAKVHNLRKVLLGAVVFHFEENDLVGQAFGEAIP